MATPNRPESGCGQYHDAQVGTLHFIRISRVLDTALPEVRMLLRFRDHPERICGDIGRLLTRYPDLVYQCITQMLQFEQQLRCSEQRRMTKRSILQPCNAAAEDLCCACCSKAIADKTVSH